MSAQRRHFHTRVISAIVILIAITLVMIPGIEDEGVVYGYGGGGGGGGGSGAPTNQNWGVCIDGNCDRGNVNFWGTTLDNFWAVSNDISIYIPKYTDMKGPENSRLTGFNAYEIDDPPSPPSGYQVLAAFNFDPDGATFDPGITINIKFDEGDIPAGKTPVIAYYNETKGEWEFIEGTIQDGQAVFTITHCSIYGLLVQAAPAPTSTPSGGTPTPAPTDDGGGLGIGAIIGIVIAALVVLAIVVYIFLGKKYGWKKTSGSA